MTKRASMLIGNIIAAVLLAVLASWAAFFAFCVYLPGSDMCQRDYAYLIVGGVAAALSLGTFLAHQHANAHAMLRPRRRPRPHIINRYNTLEKTSSTLWQVWNGEKAVKTTTLDDMLNVGWVVEFDDGYPVIVPQAEFFYWLLKVVEVQRRFEHEGQWNVASPLSQRNAGVSRQRLEAYISLLEAVHAIEYVNANVKRLKPAAAADVWKYIIKPLEQAKPLVRV